MKDQHFRFSASVVLLPFLFVLLLWIVFWVEHRFNFDFHAGAILPRTWEGLPGIFLSAFLHADLEHLYNNSISMLIFLAAIRFFYREQSMRVIWYGILISGAFTWVFGRDNYHLGASGLLYALFGFMFFKGLITRYYRLVALSLAIIMFYGGMIWYVFPGVQQNISWEGHLGGLIAGLIFAFSYKTPVYRKEIHYDWERADFDPMQDPFMRRFDEHGNFVNPPPPEPEPETEPESDVQQLPRSQTVDVRIRYVLREKHDPDA